MRELTNACKRDISELADYIATQDSDYGIPINVVKIAQDNDISFSLNDYESYFDGMLEHEDGCFHIYVNNHGGLNINTPRIRFSFVHELGHFFLDEHRTILESGNSLHCPSFYKLDQNDLFEREADFFASNLLMPVSVFSALVRGKFCFELIEKLQKTFNTSLSATLFRYIELGQTPIMVVCVTAGCIKYECHSSDFPYPYIKKGYCNRVSQLTCAGDYFSNQVECTDTEPVEAREWFNSYEDLSGMLINEKCIYQKTLNTTISILWEQD